MNTWLSWLPCLEGARVDRYALHQQLWGAFPNSPRGAPAPFTFRIEAEERYVLVRSTEYPYWPPGAGVTEETHPWPEGAVVHVDVHMTPYRRHGRKEVPMDADREWAYVERKLLQAGLVAQPTCFVEAGDDPVLPAVTVTSLWVDPSKNKRIPLRPRLVRGWCMVVDAARLQVALRHGIGGRKQFLGFGMLLVASSPIG